MKVEIKGLVKEYLEKMGAKELPSALEIPDEIYHQHRSGLRKQLPKAEKEHLDAHSTARAIWHTHHHLLAEDRTGKQSTLALLSLVHRTVKRLSWLFIVVIGLLLALLFLAVKAQAQIDVITFQDSSATKIKSYAAPFKIQCNTNVTCSASGNTVSINSSASAGSSSFQVNGVATSSQTLLNWANGTNITVANPGGAGTVTFSLSGQVGVANGGWGLATLLAHQLYVGNGTSAPTAIATGGAGQVLCSNGASADPGFCDPIVSGPDAVGATPTKNPVQIGGIFLTTPATLTNNQVGAVQLDSAQNVLVNLKTAIPAGSNVIGHVIADSGSTTAVTSLPANASVNVAQLAGTATSVNSGNKDTGTLRVVLATDQPQLTNKLLVTPDSVALPANQSVNVNQVGGTAVVADPCQANVKVYDSFSVTASTQLITGTSAKKVYFCSWNDQSAAAENYAIVEGTGSVCATGIAKVLGLSGGTTAATGWNVTAGGGRTFGNGTGAIAQEGTNADNVCILLSGSTQVNGGYSYVVQ